MSKDDEKGTGFFDMDEEDEFDLEKGMEAARKGMDQVLGSNQEFRDAFAKYVDGLPHGTIFTTDKIRQVWKGPAAHSPNCWGAATGAALKRGTIEKQPYLARPDSVRSHASIVFVYKRKNV